MPTNAELSAELAELRDQVAVLTSEAEAARADRNRAREEALNLLNPERATAAAREREKAAHEAWKRSRGYGSVSPLQQQLEVNEELQRQIALAQQAERAQKELLRERALDRQRRMVEAGETEPDDYQRAQSSAARQRQIERERRERSEREDS